MRLEEAISWITLLRMIADKPGNTLTGPHGAEALRMAEDMMRRCLERRKQNPNSK
jgi:hypothetical protein